ncbi:condensation domain-containing protein [Nocardia sp. NPDC003482]
MTTTRARTGPLTDTQRQLWALSHRVSPAALNLSYALLVAGPLAVDALRAAATDVVGEFETLRTRYPRRNDVPVAEVHDPEPVDLSRAPVHDLPAAADAAWRHRAACFDLAADPALRVRLLELGGDRRVLLLTLPHIAADGWSLHLLAERLSLAYAARLRDHPPPPTVRTAECLEVAAAQHDWLASAAATAELDWWTDHLASATAPAGPPAPLESTTHRRAIVLPAPLTGELRALARGANVSLYALLLTAFGAVLRLRAPDRPRPVIGTLAANRPTLAAAGVLGAHYNGLLLNPDLTGEPSLAECLFRTANTTVRALDHQRLPYRFVVAELRRRFGWRTGVPDAMFVLDRYPMEALRLAGCAVTGLCQDPFRPVPVVAAADPTVFVREAGERITVTAFGDPAALPGLLATYLDTLVVLCESIETEIGELCWRAEDPAYVPATALGPVTEASPADALSPLGYPEGVR